MQDVAEDQTEDDGDRRHDFEVHERLQADATERAAVADSCDTHHHAGEYDRHDDHLDQPDEDIARRLQDAADRGFPKRRETIEYQTHCDADNEADGNLPGEPDARLALGALGLRCFHDGFHAFSKHVSVDMDKPSLVWTR